GRSSPAASWRAGAGAARGSGSPGADTLLVQRGVERLVEQGADALRGGVLLGEDPARDLVGLGIAGPGRNSPQQLVAADLEVLEGECEGRKLGRRVGLSLEEHAPVERAEPERRILELRWCGPARIEPSGNQPLMLLGLLAVILVGRGELRRARQLRPLLGKLERLRLDCMRIGEVLI